MEFLQKIFAKGDGALFQANAALTIDGSCCAGSDIRAAICGGKDTVIFETKTTADDKGGFSLTLRTPAPSFEERRIEIICAKCGARHILKDVLFGELWLGSGQSNMELPNSAITDWPLLAQELKDKAIRVFHVAYPPYGGEGNFPWEPDRAMDGWWMNSGDTDKLGGVSAVALKFVSEIYDKLNAGDKDIPVGFLNATWGGTSMPSWFPYDELEADEYLSGRMKKLGNFPLRESWNTRGIGNFQQTCSQYNVKIAPLEGVKVRGVLWYQGENETGGEYHNRMYADYLRFYQRTYAKRFGADPGNFMMISSLIYPWTYGGSGECNVGYINDAFIETALESPDRFIAVPICDLEPSWAFHQSNHPIHPTNKYPLGERMARLALINVYGFGESGIQTAPAYLVSCAAEGSRLRLSFASTGGGLFVDGNSNAPVGLYIAGSDGVYLPAECEIVSGSELVVFNEAIAEPVHAAYAVQSMEPCCSLWAGDYPVLPFHTDKENRISIEAKPWFDTNRLTVWGSRMRGELLDLFWRPVWLAEPGSEVCPDSAFSLEGHSRSLRVQAEYGADGEPNSEFGCFVRAYPYNRFELSKFSRLRVNLYNTKELNAAIVVKWQGGEKRIPLTPTGDEYAGRIKIRGGWAVYEADLSGLPADTEANKLHFVFTNGGNRFRFVNLEHVRLYK